MNLMLTLTLILEYKFAQRIENSQQALPTHCMKAVNSSQTNRQMLIVTFEHSGGCSDLLAKLYFGLDFFLFFFLLDWIIKAQ